MTEESILTEILKPENLEAIASGQGGVIIIMGIIIYYLYKEYKKQKELNEHDQDEFMASMDKKDEEIKHLTTELLKVKINED